VTFQVSKLSQKDFVIIQITDTHLLEYPHLEFVGMHPEQSFHAVIDLMRQQHPQIDMIVHTGDLAQNPTTVTYDRYLKHMQSIGIPFFQTPGNHDDVSHFPFHGADPHQPTVVEIGDWCIILLNSAQPTRIDGKIAEAGLEQLTELLKKHHDRHIMIACHHHPFAMESAWIDQHKLRTHLIYSKPFNLFQISKPSSVVMSTKILLTHGKIFNFYQRHQPAYNSNLKVISSHLMKNIRVTALLNSKQTEKSKLRSIVYQLHSE
jgi:hypothetical protein